MGNSLGTEKTLQEELDESKRAVNLAIRELDRERVNLQTHEQQHIAEIKKMAKGGQSAAAKLMVKDLVRMSKQITEFYTLRSQLQAVAQRIESAQSAEATAEALQAAAQVLQSATRTMGLVRLNKVMEEFAKETRHQCPCDQLGRADPAPEESYRVEVVMEALPVWEAVPVPSASTEDDSGSSEDRR